MKDDTGKFDYLIPTEPCSVRSSYQCEKCERRWPDDLPVLRKKTICPFCRDPKRTQITSYVVNCHSCGKGFYVPHGREDFPELDFKCPQCEKRNEFQRTG